MVSRRRIKEFSNFHASLSNFCPTDSTATHHFVRALQRYSSPQEIWQSVFSPRPNRIDMGVSWFLIIVQVEERFANTSDEGSNVRDTSIIHLEGWTHLVEVVIAAHK